MSAWTWFSSVHYVLLISQRKVCWITPKYEKFSEGLRLVSFRIIPHDLFQSSRAIRGWSVAEEAVLASEGCHNKLAQIVLEARVWNAGLGRAESFWDPAGEFLLHLPASLWWKPATLVLHCSHLHLQVMCSFVYYHLWPLYFKNISRFTLLQYELLAAFVPQKVPLPRKVALWGPGCTCTFVGVLWKSSKICSPLESCGGPVVF